MRTTAEALAQAKASSTRVDSLIALFASVKQQLDEKLAGVLTPEQQADVDAIFEIDAADAAKVDAALNANTPPPAPQP